jgi:hypothetical protein
MTRAVMNVHVSAECIHYCLVCAHPTDIVKPSSKPFIASRASLGTVIDEFTQRAHAARHYFNFWGGVAVVSTSIKVRACVCEHVCVCVCVLLLYMCLV